MRSTFFSSIIFSSLCSSCLFLVAANKVFAQKPIIAPEISQVTNVRDFADVSPTDWAYSALQNLIRLYGFPQGYEDGTFRGNRPLS